jgi:transposase InsO family protein
MTQVARNLTDARDGFLRGVQYLILDRDPLYTAAFRRLLRDSSVKPLVLPTWSPNLNAFAERFVGSAKSECLELRIVPLGEGHLRAAVRAFVEHYHEERPHQGLGNELIAPKTAAIGTGAVTCRARLGLPAQVLQPRGRVAPWAEFSHTTGPSVSDLLLSRLTEG